MEKLSRTHEVTTIEVTPEEYAPLAKKIFEFMFDEFDEELSLKDIAIILSALQTAKDLVLDYTKAEEAQRN